jgi:hypothetical protein
MIRRAGAPEDVAALIDNMASRKTIVTLVNVNQSQARSVVVQAGGYGEHQFESVSIDGGPETTLNASHFTVRLEPGSGAKLTLGMRRYVNQPTLEMPWDREN